jgi:hypothetical protein
MSNQVFELAGGNEDNSLWVQVQHETGVPRISSVWELTDEERRAIADGFNIELTVYGGQPPVAMRVVNTPLGKPSE